MTPLGLTDRFEELAAHEAFQGLMEALHRGEPSLHRLSGLVGPARAPHALLLQRRLARPLLVLTASQADAESLHGSLSAWFELMVDDGSQPPPHLLPGQDVTPFEGLSPHPEIAERRAVALWRIASGRVSVVVAPVSAALLRLAPGSRYRGQAWQVEAGDEVYLEILEESLSELGYLRREPVTGVGEFSVRGGIVDVYSPGGAGPYRLEFFGDQVASIREFDPGSQQSVRRCDRAGLLPMQEYCAGGSGEGVLPAGWEFTVPGPEWRSSDLLELLPSAVVLWHDPRSIESEAAALLEGLEESAAAVGGRPGDHYMPLGQFARKAAGWPQVALDELGLDSDHPGRPAACWHVPSQDATRFGGSLLPCVQEIKAQVAAGERVTVAAGSDGDLERLADVFREYRVPCQVVLRERSRDLSRYLEAKAYVAGPVASLVVVRASVPRGFRLPDSLVSVFGAEDILSVPETVAKPRKAPAATDAFLSSLDDLGEGDFVVHVQHGVGRFLGTREASADGKSQDFLVLEYAQGVRLYVPMARADLVQRYHGAGGPRPRLDRLGGHTWERTKKRVRARLLDMADELLKLYAARRLGRGFSYSPDSNWQREFEDSFPYEPTRDQVTVMTEIKADMESEHIMDRLVCGDVGFGKTEVAMRAAFKALGDDKQVAVLVPTTVLAYQHLETFRGRFEQFPVEIEMLSRFRSPSEQRSIVKRLAEGGVDIVIGTHRLLSKDVKFRDLGLLIIDEEQRFGVRHKERLKRTRKRVDVLAMTATPIPRTLYMSLTGLRDVSVIKTPPRNRLAIQTVVAEYDDRTACSAIRREVAREGQVYFLHNRVETIDEVAARLSRAMPGVRFAVGHGQMGEKALERVMLGFMNHDTDVLVATTIIENGLDIPRANTLIVDRADLYGLAELYQLRGRVGRSDRRAYAYFLVPPDRQLTEVAGKRLAALREFCELGAGFRMAARDLELRGAGNLLGGQQSGQIAAVGLETYTRLLEEAVRELRGEEVVESINPRVRIDVDLRIPTEYVPQEPQRLQIYTLVAGVRNTAEHDRVAADLQDRFGPLPPAVANLLQYSLLKHRAESLRIPSLEHSGGRLSLRFRQDSRINPHSLMRIVTANEGARFTPDGQFEWGAFHARGPDVFPAIHDVLEKLAA